ncbi:FHA domain-containing protein [Citricoccus sp. K5]|uniref:FHA domain-containing protein FhaB/FipA n=1 Tax=Citricoccus sp. K5 TaxID=2653135 RepID=UPI0012EFFA68|nr:FHA domain-containing protein [Citricoccus sp. K5]VXB96990.1 Type III secretion system (T3SS) inner membrane Yop/YscD-like protein [Citricoccus sp. K5]
MSELAVAALRLGLLLVMWILIISIVSSQGRDLMVGARNKVRPRGKNPAPVAAGAAAGTVGSPSGGAPASGTGGQSTGQQQARPLPTRLQVTEGPLQGSVVELHGSPLLLGRAQEADLVLDDDYVSGRHARLFPQGSRWFLEDLGSTNGTYVSGSQLTRTVAVDPGTPIRIGKTVLELRS